MPPWGLLTFLSDGLNSENLPNLTWKGEHANDPNRRELVEVTIENTVHLYHLLAQQQ